MWIVSLPLQIAAQRGGALHPLDLVSSLLVCVGWCFETVGDWQLARFKATHPGEVMDRGLWRYTRHPNYFGDFLVWWGLFGLAAITHAWWTVVSPLVMSTLLLRISGVTLLEKTLRARPGYEASQKTMNRLFHDHDAPRAWRIAW